MWKQGSGSYPPSTCSGFDSFFNTTRWVRLSVLHSALRGFSRSSFLIFSKTFNSLYFFFFSSP